MRWKSILLSSGLHGHDIGSTGVLHRWRYINDTKHLVLVSPGHLLLWRCAGELPGRTIWFGTIAFIFLLFRSVFSRVLLPVGVYIK